LDARFSTFCSDVDSDSSDDEGSFVRSSLAGSNRSSGHNVNRSRSQLEAMAEEDSG